jgi:hypothetical protein
MQKVSNKIVKKHIASIAAEIMLEEGVSDYFYAKKKAAKYLNYSDFDTLPSNKEIDDAIRDYQSTYKNNDENTFELYKPIAIALMQQLEKFNPLITGTLQEGRTTIHQKILINLFTDDIKEVEYFLLSKNYQFKTKDGKKNDSHLSKYIFFFDDVETELIIFDKNESRIKSKNSSIMKGRGIKLDEFKKVASFVVS